MVAIKTEEEGHVHNGIGKKNKQKDKERYLMKREKWLCVWVERKLKDKWVDELAWVWGIIGSKVLFFA